MEGSVQFISVSPEQLKNMILDGVREIFKPKKEEEELLTPKMAASFLNVSTRTIANWTRDGRITAYGISTEIRYKKSELISSLIQIKKPLGKAV